MESKQEILNRLREEFQRWLDLPVMLSSDQRTDPLLPGELSLKDLYAHLMVWQHRSIARLEAAVQGGAPRETLWPAGLETNDEEETLQAINAWVQKRYLDAPWDQVFEEWRSGFERFLELAKRLSERELTEKGRYEWLPDYALMDVLLGSYEHHHDEHLEPLLAWLSTRGE